MLKRFKIFGIPVVKVLLIGAVGYLAINMFGGKIKEKLDSIGNKVKPS